MPKSDDLAALEQRYRAELLALSRQSQPPLSPAPTDSAPKPALSRREEHGTAINPNTGTGEPALPPLPEQESPAPDSGGPFPRREQSGVLPGKTPILRAAPLVPPRGGDGVGHIRVRVTTGSGAVPLEGASVSVELDQDGRTYLMDQLTTGGAGNTPLSKPLPTAPASESMTPGIGKPFAVYRVRVQRPGFEPFTAEQVYVFDGEISLISADLFPQRENLPRAKEDAHG